MANTKISEYSSTPASNTDIDGINIAEGCAPSGINNAIRELMSQLKDFQAGTAGDSFNGPIGTTTAAAGAFTTLAASGAVTLSGGTANGVPYLNGSKVLTSGAALTFDGSLLTTNLLRSAGNAFFYGSTGDRLNVFLQAAGSGVQLLASNNANSAYAPLNLDASLQSFNISGGEQMRLISTGLGIGTSSPGAKLNVKGGNTISTLADWNSKSNAMFELANPAVRFGIGYDSSDQVLLQGFGSNNAVRNIGIQVYGGNLGIGTSSPGDKLEIGGAGAGIILTSPNGTRFRITVSNAGALTVAAV